jgi:lipopolysaccharide biosynthesis glycosyltransferase
MAERTHAAAHLSTGLLRATAGETRVRRSTFNATAIAVNNKNWTSVKKLLSKTLHTFLKVPENLHSPKQ